MWEGLERCCQLFKASGSDSRGITCGPFGLPGGGKIVFPDSLLAARRSRTYNLDMEYLSGIEWLPVAVAIGLTVIVTFIFVAAEGKKK